MRRYIRVEVIGNEVVVTVLLDGSSQRREVGCVAEHVVLDCLEHFPELRVKLEVTVEVSVAEFFDIFSQRAEQEDVLFADFAGDFNLAKSA